MHLKLNRKLHHGDRSSLIASQFDTNIIYKFMIIKKYRPDNDLKHC
jgi:hypothetical protein